MPILTPTDQARYFPAVCQTGDALEGLLDRAQAYAEGPHGANRSLEQESVQELLDVNPVQLSSGSASFARQSIANGSLSPTYYDPALDCQGVDGLIVFLEKIPVTTNPLPTVEYQGSSYGDFGRDSYADWTPLKSSEFEVYQDGRLAIYNGQGIKRLRVNYQCGFNFEDNEDRDVKRIKSVTGLVVSRLARQDPDFVANRQVKVSGLDDFLKTTLAPLKKYVSRPGV